MEKDLNTSFNAVIDALYLNNKDMRVTFICKNQKPKTYPVHVWKSLAKSFKDFKAIKIVTDDAKRSTIYCVHI